jgi:hypothetical protein
LTAIAYTVASPIALADGDTATGVRPACAVTLAADTAGAELERPDVHPAEETAAIANTAT